VLNAKKMYEEAQMVRRVKAYLAKMPVISDEDELMKRSEEVEPSPTSSSSQPVAHQSRTLSGQGSVGSLSVSFKSCFYCSPLDSSFSKLK